MLVWIDYYIHYIINALPESFSSKTWLEPAPFWDICRAWEARRRTPCGCHSRRRRPCCPGPGWPRSCARTRRRFAWPPTREASVPPPDETCKKRGKLELNNSTTSFHLELPEAKVSLNFQENFNVRHRRMGSLSYAFFRTWLRAPLSPCKCFLLWLDRSRTRSRISEVRRLHSQSELAFRKCRTETQKVMKSGTGCKHRK